MHRILVNIVIAMGLVYIPACRGEGSSLTSVNKTTLSEGTVSPASAAYHPYGVSVPVGTIVSLPPEPYDPAIHGSALPNTMPHKNVASRGPGEIPINERARLNRSRVFELNGTVTKYS
jgi:hypothetical protein